MKIKTKRGELVRKAISLGSSNTISHSKTIVIGDGLKTREERQLLIGCGGCIVVDKVLSEKEWEMLYKTLIDCLQP